MTFSFVRLCALDEVAARQTNSAAIRIDLVMDRTIRARQNRVKPRPLT
jgi:hypothetical protein